MFQPPLTSHAQATLKEIEELRELVVDIPERGYEFGAGVSDTLDAIESTIKRSGFSTEGQDRALANIRGGLERWLHR